jgi:Type I phosphodiesterase / nucleotide pyrophosphatase
VTRSPAPAGASAPPVPEASALLAECATAVPGLYRTHPSRNLGAVAAHVVDAYRGQRHQRGRLRLGHRRRLVVLAVDGFGYAIAGQVLTPTALEPLTSGFPTTTAPCLLTSVTGRAADEHGVIGVQYLHPDGRRTVDCHTGRVNSPRCAVPPRGAVPARPTRAPALPTIFQRLGALGVGSVAVPGALAGLSPALRRRLLRGCHVDEPTTHHGDEPAIQQPADLAAAVAAVLARVGDLARTGEPALTWAYLDLDSHIHRHGNDRAVLAAGRAIDAFADRLRRDGVAVLLYSDHGLAANAPGARTLEVWHEADSPRWCRLPAGGAGRVRWLYPHAGRRDRLIGWLSERLPGVVVTTPERLAELGIIRAASVGARRLGEVVLLAQGPDFPAADSAAFEHGSMTADELLVPLAIWQPE